MRWCLGHVDGSEESYISGTQESYIGGKVKGGGG